MMNFHARNIDTSLEVFKNVKTNIIDSARLWVRVDDKVFGYVDMTLLPVDDRAYFSAKWLQIAKLPNGYTLSAFDGLLHLHIDTVILPNGKDVDSTDPTEALPFFKELMMTVTKALQKASGQLNRRII